MKKLLFIKLEAPSFSSIGMETAFREHYLVESVNWQHFRFNHGLAGLWNEIINKCIAFMPDIIFCQFQKEEVLNIQQFIKLSEYGFVINYTEDVRENISWYEGVGRYIGLTIFTNEDDVEKMKSKGIMNVAFLPVGYNHIWYKPQPKTETDYGEIVFVGNNYVGTNLNFPYAQERQDMIAFMKDRFGDKFQAYGMGHANGILSPARVIEAYNNAKVVVTQSNFKRRGYMSDRGLNAIGCGAITIHQHYEGIEEMFEGFQLLSTWKTFEDLEKMCKFFLVESNPLSQIHFKERVSDYARHNHSWLARITDLNYLIKLHRYCYKPLDKSKIRSN